MMDRDDAFGAAKDYAAGVASAAGMVIVSGRALWQWGDVSRRVNVHSIRKSLLSAVWGIHVAAGTIEVTASLRSLGIDDREPGLTAVEKEARLIDLLGSRSGVFHPAVYETPEMKAARPARGSHAPGTFWYYNNWDFNVLGTVFERLTRTRLFEEFALRIARPIGMQDFSAGDGRYETGPESDFPAYPVRLSTRDMARFGLLFLRRGRWDGHPIVPADWIDLSTQAHSAGGEEGAYGLLWWRERSGWFLGCDGFPTGAFAALGTRGNSIVIVPSMDLVVVNTVDTDDPRARMSWQQVGTLVKLILRAAGRA